MKKNITTNKNQLEKAMHIYKRLKDKKCPHFESKSSRFALGYTLQQGTVSRYILGVDTEFLKVAAILLVKSKRINSLK